MVDPTSVGIVETFRLLIESVKAVKDLATTGEIKGRVTELYEVILAGQQRALESNVRQQALLDDIRQLKEELARIKAWGEEKQRYKLIRPWDGNPAVLYALKESHKASEEAHWICTKCYDDDRRSILVPKLDKAGYVILACPTCKAELHTSYHDAGPPQYAKD